MYYFIYHFFMTIDCKKLIKIHVFKDVQSFIKIAANSFLVNFDDIFSRKNEEIWIMQNSDELFYFSFFLNNSQ